MVGLTKDAFARATAKRAHAGAADAATTANQALEIALAVRKVQQDARQPMFVGRCSLCGDPCKPRQKYCWGHSWAA